MKKATCVILLLAAGIYLAGCAKKDQSLTEMEEPIPLEELGKLQTQGAVAPEVTTGVEPAVTVSLYNSKTEQLPLTAAAYKPTVQETQTALKNAGYYTGLVDGKKGPLTKKAIEDFQKANNLQADGKVGPRTWAVLSPYLNPAPASSKPGKKR